jgi:hypothetical protein
VADAVVGLDLEDGHELFFKDLRLAESLGDIEHGEPLVLNLVPMHDGVAQGAQSRHPPGSPAANVSPEMWCVKA